MKFFIPFVFAAASGIVGASRLTTTSQLLLSRETGGRENSKSLTKAGDITAAKASVESILELVEGVTSVQKADSENVSDSLRNFKSSVVVKQGEVEVKTKELEGELTSQAKATEALRVSLKSSLKNEEKSRTTMADTMAKQGQHKGAALIKENKEAMDAISDIVKKFDEQPGQVAFVGGNASSMSMLIGTLNSMVENMKASSAAECTNWQSDMGVYTGLTEDMQKSIKMFEKENAETYENLQKTSTERARVKTEFALQNQATADLRILMFKLIDVKTELTNADAIFKSASAGLKSKAASLLEALSQAQMDEQMAAAALMQVKAHGKVSCQQRRKKVSQRQLSLAQETDACMELKTASEKIAELTKSVNEEQLAILTLNAQLAGINDARGNLQDLVSWYGGTKDTVDKWTFENTDAGLTSLFGSLKEPVKTLNSNAPEASSIQLKAFMQEFKSWTSSVQSASKKMDGALKTFAEAVALSHKTFEQMIAAQDEEVEKIKKALDPQSEKTKKLEAELQEAREKYAGAEAKCAPPQEDVPCSE